MASLTINQVAERLGTSHAHVRRLITAGELRAIHIGRHNASRRTLRIMSGVLDQFLASREEETDAEPLTPRRRSPNKRSRLAVAGLL